MMKKILLTSIALSLLIAHTANAKVVLPNMFSDNMVIQRESMANFWGIANPNANVKITASWDSKAVVSVKANNQGQWKTSIPTPVAGGPFSITFDDGDKASGKTILNNVLSGEVWICAGQSNMEMPMKGFKNQPVEGGVEDVLHCTDPLLRLFTVKRTSTTVPKTDVTGDWRECVPLALRDFSATAYYFGKELRQSLGVPVGLICAAWGGSSCEAWMHKDWLKAFPEAKIPANDQEITSKNRNPTVLYNGMLKPLIGYTIRGAIWYQGEDNVPRFNTYADMMTRMVKGWRDDWQQGEFPFFYCQIAPYDYTLVNMKPNSALLREQQSKAELMIPNCGMAVLMDCGMETGIHPRKKNLAGMRLALLALNKTYGIDGLPCESAYFKDMTIAGDTCTISFERANMWIYGEKGYLSECFEVAGADKVFHPAKAVVERSKVIVTCPHVKQPVAVRYAFKDWVHGDLYCDGIPVSSFRTDNWDIDLIKDSKQAIDYDKQR